MDGSHGADRWVAHDGTGYGPAVVVVADCAHWAWQALSSGTRHPASLDDVPDDSADYLDPRNPPQSACFALDATEKSAVSVISQQGEAEVSDRCAAVTFSPRTARSPGPAPPPSPCRTKQQVAGGVQPGATPSDEE
ncbi:hypothetical protein Sxan_28560 [Streptomyces xanthophaeus]|uniref:Uncharacterized protein n=1 Tax=Streptomyces xanthophaeus TaxID=67385 RepID=A0A919GY54_9ACTN|nr:hypothetical protein Sxan_28560 [Streptomyces xanthophaeus]